MNTPTLIMTLHATLSRREKEGLRWSNVSTACCRRPNVGNAAMTAAARTPKPWLLATPALITARLVATLARVLAHLLGVALPYNRSRGEHKPARVAVIVEADCIGCTKCIQACPVDAIVGGAKYMHTVLADLCTGCELCIPPCPVDCIELQVAANPGFVGAA